MSYFQGRKPADDKEAAFFLVHSVLEEGAFSNLAVKDMDKSGFDRAFIRAALYGTVAYAYSIDFIIKETSGKLTSKMTPEVRSLLRFAVWEIFFSTKVPDFAAVSTAVEISRKYFSRASGFVNAVLRKVTAVPESERTLDKYRPEIEVSLKPELYGILKKSYGKERALSIGKAFLETPKISLRFNPALITADELISELSREGIKAVPSDLVKEAVILPEGVPSKLDKLRVFREGIVFVQNEAAMLASVYADPKPGMTILDTCSAPGGKSTHMAQLAGDDCRIISLDSSPKRLELVRQNADRLKLKSITAYPADCTKPKFLNGISDEKDFDIVLVDAPCSGLGLIARKPDIRHTLTYERVLEIVEVQKRILSNSAFYVKNGGRLVYSTCTLNKAENELQVENFLNEHSEFRCESMRTLFPDTDGCDGFFISVLTKESGI